MSPAAYRFAADLVLLAHFAYVAFVVIGLLLVWVGYFARWAWVRNPWFRLAHLAAMGIVLAESVFGVTCPLTTWEDQLRRLGGASPGYSESFMQHWIHKIMFIEGTPVAFTIAYALVFGAIVLSFWVVPVAGPWNRPRRSPNQEQG